MSESIPTTLTWEERQRKFQLENPFTSHEKFCFGCDELRHGELVIDSYQIVGGKRIKEVVCQGCKQILDLIRLFSYYNFAQIESHEGTIKWIEEYYDEHIDTKVREFDFTDDGEAEDIVSKKLQIGKWPNDNKATCSCFKARVVSIEGNNNVKFDIIPKPLSVNKIKYVVQTSAVSLNPDWIKSDVQSVSAILQISKGLGLGNIVLQHIKENLLLTVRDMVVVGIYPLIESWDNYRIWD
ncbi:MAG TPA: hypothetical protein VFJ05_07045 [Nitrososphaeraceae archaeon]|nr:hypothetical protein [Nitrososphaeraceae archaeon]